MSASSAAEAIAEIYHLARQQLGYVREGQWQRVLALQSRRNELTAALDSGNPRGLWPLQDLLGRILSLDERILSGL